MKKTLLLVLLGVCLFPFAVNAAEISVGNDTDERDEVGTAKELIVIDKNNPVSADGELDKFEYYAAEDNPFYFFIVDENNKLKWVGEEITPEAGDEGVYEEEVEVEEGWQLGIYYTNGGSVTYSEDGEKAQFLTKEFNYDISDKINFSGRASRTYSFVATGTATVTDAEEEEEEDLEDEDEDEDDNATSTVDLEPINEVLQNRSRCMAGQWAQIEGGHGFINQGQCVAYYNQMIQGHINNILRLIQKAYVELVAETQKQVNAKKAAGLLNQGQQKQADLACDSNDDCTGGKICNGGGKCVTDDGDENDQDEDAEEDDNTDNGGSKNACDTNSDCTGGKICSSHGKCVADADTSETDDDEDEGEDEE